MASVSLRGKTGLTCSRVIIDTIFYGLVLWILITWDELTPNTRIPRVSSSSGQAERPQDRCLWGWPHVRGPLRRPRILRRLSHFVFASLVSPRFCMEVRWPWRPGAGRQQQEVQVWPDTCCYKYGFIGTWPRPLACVLSVMRSHGDDRGEYLRKILCALQTSRACMENVSWPLA